MPQQKMLIFLVIKERASMPLRAAA